MDSNRTVYVFSIGAEHTNARYFARAIDATEGWRCVYVDALFDLSVLKTEDVFFYVDPAPAWPLGLERLPCLTMAYIIDVHLDLPSGLNLANFFDVVFIAQKDYVPAFRQQGHPHVYWLPVACEPGVQDEHPGERPYDVGFVGKLGMRGTSRYETLTTVLPKFRTNDYLRRYSLREMEAVYGQSKIVFNASINGDVNMRVFEGMAAGALLVTDRIGNGLSELLEEGTHYIGYSSIPEAIDQIKFFLNNNDERDRIARAGQRFVLTHRTYAQCWEYIRRHSDSVFGDAPARSYSRVALGELYAAVFVWLRQPWRIIPVLRRYGLTGSIAFHWLTAWGRWVNSRVPLTPNAIKARLYS